MPDEPARCFRKWPKPLLTWLTAVLGVLAVIFLVGLWNKFYAIGLFLSLVHADFAIAYWQGVGTDGWLGDALAMLIGATKWAGVGVWPSIIIAIACGTISLYNLFWLADRSLEIAKAFADFWRKTSLPSKILLWLLSVSICFVAFTMLSLNWWAAIILSVSCMVVPFVVSRLRDFYNERWPKKSALCGATDYTTTFRKIPYFALIFFPIDPYFGASLGIAFSKTLGLKRWPSFLFLTLGNTIKMILFGFGINFIKKASSSPLASYCLFVGTLLAILALVLYVRKRKAPSR